MYQCQLHLMYQVIFSSCLLVVTCISFLPANSLPCSLSLCMQLGNFHFVQSIYLWPSRVSMTTWLNCHLIPLAQSNLKGAMLAMHFFSPVQHASEGQTCFLISNISRTFITKICQIMPSVLCGLCLQAFNTLSLFCVFSVLIMIGCGEMIVLFSNCVYLVFCKLSASTQECLFLVWRNVLL